jgi:hypothetical protein
MQSAYVFVVEKSQRRKLIGDLGHRYEGVVAVDLKESNINFGAGCICLDEIRWLDLVNVVVKQQRIN